MPVLVTGAHTAAGRAAIGELLRGGGEVRAWVDEEAAPGAVQPLRAMGAKVGRGTLDDEGRLELALEQVHTVVHLATTLLDRPDEVLDGVASVLSAAVGAGCRRLIWTSWIGADSAGDSEWLHACAEAESLLSDAPLETVVVRTALRYGPADPLSLALARAVPRPAAAARHAPLYVDDLAVTVAAVDRERGRAGDLHLVVPLCGPDVVTLAELSAALGGGRARRGDALPEYALDVLARDTLGPPGAIGRSATRVAVGAARVRGRQEHSQ